MFVTINVICKGTKGAYTVFGWIPKNQRRFATKYNIRIVGTDNPTLINTSPIVEEKKFKKSPYGVNPKPTRIANATNTTIIEIKIGSKDSLTIGGTPSGILNFNPFLDKAWYICAVSKEIINATKIPFPPKLSNWNAAIATPSFPITVCGITTRKLNKPKNPHDNALSFLRFAKL